MGVISAVEGGEGLLGSICWSGLDLGVRVGFHNHGFGILIIEFLHIYMALNIF